MIWQFWQIIILHFSFLFVADCGLENGKILKTSLSGVKRKTLDLEINCPVTIAVDMPSQTVIWVDDTGNVESATYDLTQRYTKTRLRDLDVFDIAIDPVSSIYIIFTA